MGWKLISVAEEEKNETVKALLPAGADVNVKAKDDCKVRMLVSYSGHTEADKVLLDAGAAMLKLFVF